MARTVAQRHSVVHKEGSNRAVTHARQLNATHTQSGEGRRNTNSERSTNSEQRGAARTAAQGHSLLQKEGSGTFFFGAVAAVPW